jgi:hypothetical protein
MRRTSAAALGVLMVLATAPAAGAAERGVHVDPGSPAGKEYAIPIERARREASGGTKIGTGNPTSSTAVAQVPLFGQGIKPAAPKHHARQKGTHGSATKPDVPLASTAAIQAALRAPSTSGWTGGIPAAVLAAGVLLALGLGRLRRRA